MYFLFCSWDWTLPTSDHSFSYDSLYHPPLYLRFFINTAYELRYLFYFSHKHVS